jgi:hypothetical protein
MRACPRSYRVFQAAVSNFRSPETARRFVSVDQDATSQAIQRFLMRAARKYSSKNQTKDRPSSFLSKKG